MDENSAKFDLDRKINRIHKSTKTLLPIFRRHHDQLRQRFDWYYRWHTFSNIYFAHWSFAFAFALTVFVLIANLYNSPPGSSYAETIPRNISVTAVVPWTIAATVDFPNLDFGELTILRSRYATPDGGSDIEVVGNTLSVTTNNPKGYLLQMRGLSLRNTLTDYRIKPIAEADILRSNTEQFGVKISTSGGAGQAYSPYNTSKYAFIERISGYDQTIAGSDRPSETTHYHFTYGANITGTVEAGNYIAYLTFTVIPNF